jgi:hypothetical protein
VKKNTFVIPAECHSDDHAVEVEFDAAGWFKTADDRALEKVALDGWAFGYGTDVIAQDEAERNPKIAAMFSYLEARNNVEAIGFGCSVNREKALAWMKNNKPKLFAEFVKLEY